MEKQLKSLLLKYRGSIKSIWLQDREIYFLAKNRQKEIEKSALRSMKGYKVKIFLLNNYFENVFEGNLNFYENINQAQVLYDPNSFIDPIKKMVESGKITGTKQSFLLKFLKISEHFKKVNSIKFDVLNNSILLIVESSQAALLEYADKVPSLRKVPDYLEKYLVPRGLEKRYMEWVSGVIKNYKEIEHGNRGLPSGTELDIIQKKAEEFRDRINAILESSREEN